jgi:Zn-dependent M28 family amino/carboxypeptidase
MFRFLFFLTLISNAVFSQKISKSDKQLLTYLKSNVTYLASDELEGRRAGTNGESLAADFIAGKFKEIGLFPKGASESFFQPFTVNDGKVISTKTFFSINNKVLRQNSDYFPLSNSLNFNSFKGQISPFLTEKGQPWFLDLADDLEENKTNPHFDISNLISTKITKAKENGATAIILFNSSSIVDNLKFDSKDRTELLPIPVMYLKKDAFFTYVPDKNGSYDLSFSIDIIPNYRNAKNVLGYIDNKATLTIVLGAHFDHLGYGEDGNSMIRSGEKLIHNGADDNASGTAALIELAFLIKKSKIRQYNFLFIAFSAEELGLNGSKFFVENPTISLNSINYMINMDMVGRMNDSTKTITVGGYGTSPSWKSIFDNVKSKNFSIKFDSSGSGPSDHTSFYRKDIPVLFFFTGLHTDYHKPSDDADKINYLGQLYIVRFISQLIASNISEKKLVFTKTREQQTSTSARFSVSMGIMPDYSFSGNGVRVDGVSDNRPAKKAGLLAGDILKQLGDFKTSSVESYMQALGKFKKGDSAKVLFLRGTIEMQVEVIF